MSLRTSLEHYRAQEARCDLAIALAQEAPAVDGAPDLLDELRRERDQWKALGDELERHLLERHRAAAREASPPPVLRQGRLAVAGDLVDPGSGDAELFGDVDGAAGP